MGFVAGPPPVPEPSRHERYCDAREYLIDRYGGMTDGVRNVNWQNEFQDLLYEHCKLKSNCEDLKADLARSVSKKFCQDFLNGEIPPDDFVARVLSNG